MPTFTLRNPIFFGEVGDWTADGIGYEMEPDGPKTGTLTSTFTGASQVVTSADGTFNVAAAPAGFEPTTNLKAHMNWAGSLGLGASMSRTMVGVTDNTTTSTIDIPLPDGLTLGQLIAGFNTFICTLAATGFAQAVYTEFTSAYISITGNYTMFAFSWDLPQDGEDVVVGETITITSPTPHNPATDLDLSELTLSWACGIITPIIQTQSLLTFLVPESCDGEGLQTLVATGNGVQFSGSVTLGTMTVLLTNGSGVYRLVMGKRNDTYYSSHRDGTTIDLKIPNPTAKTGFIGG